MLDDPSRGLAPMAVSADFHTIRELNRTGVSILLVEQNARMAPKIADRAIALDRGRVTTSGTSRQLLDDRQVQHAVLGRRQLAHT